MMMMLARHERCWVAGVAVAGRHSTGACTCKQRELHLIHDDMLHRREFTYHNHCQNKLAKNCISTKFIIRTCSFEV